MLSRLLPQPRLEACMPATHLSQHGCGLQKKARGKDKGRKLPDLLIAGSLPRLSPWFRALSSINLTVFRLWLLGVLKISAAIRPKQLICLPLSSSLRSGGNGSHGCNLIRYQAAADHQDLAFETMFRGIGSLAFLGSLQGKEKKKTLPPAHTQTDLI
jgi:hypothetical protein